MAGFQVSAEAGNTVMWRGVSRLTDIELGFIMGAWALNLWVIERVTGRLP
jgi:hypothetical protein